MWYMLKNKAIFAFLLAGCMLLSSCQQAKPVIAPLEGENLISSDQANYKTTTADQTFFQKEGQGVTAAVYPVTKTVKWENGSARFKEAYVANGKKVKAGDVLMTFEVNQHKADLENLRLQLSRKEKEVATNTATRKEAIQTAKANAVGLTSHELTIANLKIEKLQASYEQYLYQSNRELAQIKENIAELEEKAADDTIVAPFDGTIRSITVFNEGDLVNNGTVLYTIYSTDYVLLNVERNASMLRYNMDVVVETGRKNDRVTYSGKVVSTPTMLPNTISQSVAVIKLNIPVSEEQLKAGSNTFTCVSQNLQNVIMVDKKAIYSEEKSNFVYILEEDTLKKRYVIKGLSNSEKIWVLDGLTDGQVLVID